MRGSRRSCRSTRSAVASVMRGLTRRLRSTSEERLPPGRARRSRSSSAGGARWRRAGRRASAAARRSASASSITWLDTSSVVPPSASAWKVPTGRAAAPGRGRPSARRARAARARPSSALASDTRARCPPESLRRPASACRPRPTVAITSSMRSGRPSEHPREVAEVLAHGQVGVHRRRLGHVADAPAQLGRARRLAEHGDRRPPSTICTPTTARISVVFPQPLGPSRPVTARPRRSARARQHDAPPLRREGRRPRLPVGDPSLDEYTRCGPASQTVA